MSRRIAVVLVDLAAAVLNVALDRLVRDDTLAVAQAVGVVPEQQETPIHDALHAKWRRNANDYARAMADLEYVQTVDDLAVVGGWE